MTSALITDPKIAAAVVAKKGETVLGAPSAPQQQQGGSDEQQNLFSEIFHNLTLAGDVSSVLPGQDSGQTQQPIVAVTPAGNKASLDEEDAETNTGDEVDLQGAPQLMGLPGVNNAQVGGVNDVVLSPTQSVDSSVKAKTNAVVELASAGTAFQSTISVLMRQRTQETSEDDLTSSPARNGAEVDTSKPMLRQDTNLLLTSIGANNPVNQLAAESKNVRVGQSEGASNITPSEVPPISLASPSSEQSSPTSLKLLSGSPAEWRQSLMEALGDRIQVGIGQRSEQATIRLDPPMLGSVEITIRHQAGTLQVQLSASNGEVTRQLQHISDGLRQELSQRQFTGVSVQVGNHQSDRDGRERQQYLAQTDEVPLRAWDDANTAGSSKFSLNTN